MWSLERKMEACEIFLIFSDYNEVLCFCWVIQLILNFSSFSRSPLSRLVMSVFTWTMRTSFASTHAKTCSSAAMRTTATLPCGNTRATMRTWTSPPASTNWTVRSASTSSPMAPVGTPTLVWALEQVWGWVWARTQPSRLSPRPWWSPRKAGGGERTASVRAASTVGRCSTTKTTGGGSAKTPPTRSSSASTKSAACSAPRACCTTACPIPRATSQTPAHVTHLTSSSACAGWPWWRCPSSRPACAATCLCAPATTVARHAAAVGASTRPRGDLTTDSGTPSKLANTGSG